MGKGDMIPPAPENAQDDAPSTHKVLSVQITSFREARRLCTDRDESGKPRGAAVGNPLAEMTISQPVPTRVKLNGVWMVPASMRSAAELEWDWMAANGETGGVRRIPTENAPMLEPASCSELCWVESHGCHTLRAAQRAFLEAWSALLAEVPRSLTPKRKARAH